MAKGDIPLNSPERMKLFAYDLEAEVVHANPLSAYMGEGPNSTIRIHRDLQKGRGAEFQFPILDILTGRGFMGTASREEVAEELSTRFDTLKLNAYGHSTVHYGRIYDQTIGYNTASEHKGAHANRNVWFTSQAMFLQLAGITGQFRDYASRSIETVYRQDNPTLPSEYVMGPLPRAPRPERTIRPNGRANDQALVAGDVFSFSLIDQALVMADDVYPKMSGDLVCFISPRQLLSLKQDPSGLWRDVSIAEIQSGMAESKQTMKKGTVFRYANVEFVPTPYVPFGNHSTTGALTANAQRAVLCGRQALSVCYGAGSTEGSSWSWYENEADVGSKTYYASEVIMGMTKTQYAKSRDTTDFTDYGVITIPTYVG